MIRVLLTVTGVDYWNNARTETITGANAGESQGNIWWKTVSQISAGYDGTVIAGKHNMYLNKNKRYRWRNVAFLNGESIHKLIYFWLIDQEVKIVIWQ